MKADTLFRGRGDEHTFVRFTLDDNGEVTDLHHRQKSIVYAAHPSPGKAHGRPAMIWMVHHNNLQQALLVLEA